MSLEDMDPGVRPWQVWSWKSPLDAHEAMYFLLHDFSKEEEYEIVWQAIDLNDGSIKYIYSVGQNTSWKRHV
jgi:hypothetical protein